jgi:hypothetical protein
MMGVGQMCDPNFVETVQEWFDEDLSDADVEVKCN